MCLGPVGMIVGGIMLSAGFSGGLNTIQQGFSDEEEFSYGSLGVSAGIGAVGGGIAAPFAVGGAVIANTLSTAGKVAVTIGAGSVGGSLSGGATKALINLTEGKNVAEGVGTAFLTGAIAGGIGAGAGQAARGAADALNSGATTIGQDVGKNAIIRVTAQTIGGATGGAAGGAASKFVENMINKGEITKKDLQSYLNAVTDHIIA